MMMKFTVKADAAQPVLIVVNNVNVNFINPTEAEVLIVRADALREEAETPEEKSDAKPATETREED